MIALAEPRPRGNILAPYLALAALWLLTITIVPPRGDFPLNDDWMYAKMVKHLVDTGEYQANPYADPTFILQAYWGAAWAKLFGFSFETLRLSTLALGLIAVWAAHWAAREAGLTPRWAFLVALTLLVNPFFLNLSYTFMTDVPFIALTTLSGAACLRAFRTEQLKWYALAVAIAMIGYFVRQFSLVLFLAGIHFAYSPTSHARGMESVKRGGTALLLLVFLLVVPALTLPLGGLGLSGGWDWSRLGGTWSARALEILRHLSIVFTYLALMAAPIFTAVAVFKSLGTKSSKRWALLSGLTLAIFLLMYTAWPYRLPNMGNMLYDFGVGPLLLPGMIEDDAIAAPVRVGATVWWVFTILAIPRAASFALLHLRAGLRVRFTRGEDSSVRAKLFLALWSIGLLLVLIMPPVLARFNRYIVMAQVPATILVARWLAALNPKPAIPAYVVAALFWVIGLFCLQDYLAWNAARWKALVALQQTHNAPLEQINGGYEFNGWFHSDHYAEESLRTGKKIFGPLGWWIRGDDYRVSLRPNKHFEVIGSEPYFSWLGFQRREILLLKRTEPDENFAFFN